MTIEDNARLAAVTAQVGALDALGLLDTSWTGPSYHGPAEAAAAAFILANRDAPAQSIPIQLALKKLGGSMKPSATDVMLWSVFRDVFLRVFDHLKARDDAETAALQAAVGFGRQGLPLDQAMQTQPGGFDAAGFSPRR